MTASGRQGYEFLEFWCWNLVPFLPDTGFQLLKSLWSSLTYLSFNDVPNAADGTADCVYRQWFLEVFLDPFSNVNDRIMPMSDAVSSEGPKTTGIQQRSSALSLTHRDLQSLCNLTLRNVVFKVFHNVFMHSNFKFEISSFRG